MAICRGSTGASQLATCTLYYLQLGEKQGRFVGMLPYCHSRLDGCRIPLVNG